ncbi:MAG: hypothetical protein INQ03_10475 [Candidatus Heimdallarchaeota archaeon]|nr:hypothetical protein [Candidatus Heimdallarchaeota archaeon]
MNVYIIEFFPLNKRRIIISRSIFLFLLITATLFSTTSTNMQASNEPQSTIQIDLDIMVHEDWVVAPGDYSGETHIVNGNLYINSTDPVIWDKMNVTVQGGINIWTGGHSISSSILRHDNSSDLYKYISIGSSDGLLFDNVTFGFSSSFYSTMNNLTITNCSFEKYVEYTEHQYFFDITGENFTFTNNMVRTSSGSIFDFYYVKNYLIQNNYFEKNSGTLITMDSHFTAPGMNFRLINNTVSSISSTFFNPVSIKGVNDAIISGNSGDMNFYISGDDNKGLRLQMFDNNLQGDIRFRDLKDAVVRNNIFALPSGSLANWDLGMSASIWDCSYSVFMDNTFNGKTNNGMAISQNEGSNLTLKENTIIGSTAIQYSGVRTTELDIYFINNQITGSVFNIPDLDINLDATYELDENITLPIASGFTVSEIRYSFNDGDEIVYDDHIQLEDLGMYTLHIFYDFTNGMHFYFQFQLEVIESPTTSPTSPTSPTSTSSTPTSNTDSEPSNSTLDGMSFQLPILSFLICGVVVLQRRKI